MEIVPALMPGGSEEAPEDADYSPWTGIIPYTLERGAPVPGDQVG